jgi:hypothetical protein
MASVRVGGGSSVSRAGTLRPQGTYAGTFDPSLGLPTLGTGKNGAILKGDWWIASATGTISGLEPFTTFAINDRIDSLINNASLSSHFIGNKGTSGSGDVVGPSSATDGAIVLFDGVTGKLIKNSAYTPSSFDSSGAASAVQTNLSAHTSNTSNPHSTTAAQVGAYTTGSTDTLLAAKQSLVNAASALSDGAAITLSSIKHTLSTTQATITFTDTYTGDFLSVEVTFNTTEATWTFPTGSKTVYINEAGTATTSTTTIVIAGATSGDKLVLSRGLWGSAYYYVVKNFG